MHLTIVQSPPTRGFTLSEVLVATVFMLVLAAAVFTVYRQQQFTLLGQNVQLETQETARALVDLMSREIRLAGCDPRCVKTFTGIVDARSQLLQFQGDTNADGAIGAGEMITYSYDSTARTITRTVNGVATDIIGGVSDALTFTYYDGTGAVLSPTGSPPALTAVQRNAVRRVRIALHLQRPHPDPRNPGVLVTDASSNVDLRNRFLNGSVSCP